MKIIFTGILIISLALNPEFIIASDYIINNSLKTSLNQGEIMAENISRDDGVKGIRVVFAVDTTAEKIWRLITDYTHFKDIFGDISMKLLHEDDKGAEVDASLLVFHYTLYHAYVELQRKLTWKKVRGDLNVVEGSWTIIPFLHNRQLVVYESYLDAGNAFYNWLAHYNSQNRGKQMVKKIKAYISRHY